MGARGLGRCIGGGVFWLKELKELLSFGAVRAGATLVIVRC